MSRAHRAPGSQACTAKGCRNRRTQRSRFCGPCWFRLPLAVRLAVDEALRHYHHRATAALAAAKMWLNRHPVAVAVRVGVCGHCHRSSADPVIRCCTDTSCPLAVKEAA